MTVLIADDDKSIIASLKLLLASEGIASQACLTPADTLARVRERRFQLALVDLNYGRDATSGKEGLDLIAALRRQDDQLPIVAMTGWGSIPVAVEAVRRGAVDFIEKPWPDNKRLLSLLQAYIRLNEISRRETLLSAENRLLKQQTGADQPIVTCSPLMSRLLESARRIARSDIPVLILGENGTGKSLLAAYIHAHSRRSAGSLITLNVGGITDAAFESEIFGHVKGAFTDAKEERIGRVELAEEGTLFLDEIANMPISQQAKMLRLLEERQYEKLGSSLTLTTNARFISATNANLGVLVKEKDFRPDLLYRLNGITLHLPALRERPEDIPLLARQFLDRAKKRYDTVAESFSEEAVIALRTYPWPGNVRELSHVVERASLLALDSEIQSCDLQLPSKSAFPDKLPVLPETIELEALTLEQAEAFLIGRALSRHGRNVELTAEKLGLSRSALYRRLQRYGIK